MSTPMGLTRYSQRSDVGAAGPEVSAAWAAGAMDETELIARIISPAIRLIFRRERRDGVIGDLLTIWLLLIITGPRGGSIPSFDDRGGTLYDHSLVLSEGELSFHGSC